LSSANPLKPSGACTCAPDPARVVVRQFKPADGNPGISTPPTNHERTTSFAPRPGARRGKLPLPSWPRFSRTSTGGTAISSKIFEAARRWTWKTRWRHIADSRRKQRRLPRRLFSARVFLRSRGAVQSEHRRAPRPGPARLRAGRRFILSVRAVGRRTRPPSLTFRSGAIAADGAVMARPHGAALGVHSTSDAPGFRARRVTAIELTFGSDEDISEAGDLSCHRRPVERRRRCAGFLGIRRRNREGVFTQRTPGVQRQGDKVGAARDA